MLDKDKYVKKPEEAGSIVNRLTRSKTRISVDKLAEALLNGQTMRPAVCGNKETDWIQQQLFCLDFDNDVKFKSNLTGKEIDWDKSIEPEEQCIRDNCYIFEDVRTTLNEELANCRLNNLIPAFGYYSFNSSKDYPRWRFVFVCNEVITDFQVAKTIQSKLCELFNKSDRRCTNLNRHYYGGNGLIEFDTKNTFKINQLDIDTVQGEKNPHDNKRVLYSINLLGGKTQHDENYNIKAISNRDTKYLKEKLNHPHLVFENNQEFCDYIFKEINLGELLEIKYCKSFKCLFHNDTTPSASIFQNENGYWMYHCFGCGVSYNLLNVIEALGNFKSRPKAYKFIRDIFNLEIAETEWQREQKDILFENLKSIENGELESNCPIAYKNISRNLKALRQYMLIAIDNVYNDKLTDDSDNVVFYASTKYLCRQLGMSENSAKEISKKTALFQYHNLLNKLSDEEIPERMLKRSQAINSNSENPNNRNYRKHINCFSIPSYNTNLYKKIEKQGVAWKDNNYTMTGCSREMFFRGEGKVVADCLYPQYKQVYDFEKKQTVDRTTSPSSDKRTVNIVNIIFDIIESQGYALEDQITNVMVQQEICSKTAAKSQIKKSLKEISDAYGLEKIRFNKQTKEKFHAQIGGYPNAIVKSDKVQ